MAAIEVELPALGESVVEGTVSRWLVKEGDAVERDQPLVEVTTDKVDAEIPAPESGVVEKILVPEGETVAVGTTLATLATGVGAGAAARAPAAEKKTAPPPAPPSAPAAAPAPGAPAATPLARRVAEQERVDLRAVEPSGPAGKITRDDVVRSARPAAASAPPVAPAAAAQPAAVPRYDTSAPAGRPAYLDYVLQEGD